MRCIGSKLVQQSIPGAAPYDMDSIKTPTTDLFQSLQDPAVLQRQALKSTAHDSALRLRNLLVRLAAVGSDLLRHLARLGELVGINVDKGGEGLGSRCKARQFLMR